MREICVQLKYNEIYLTNIVPIYDVASSVIYCIMGKTFVLRKIKDVLTLITVLFLIVKTTKIPEQVYR